tara:strand:+ start:253 stop:561 length:309 start_codon:yes stop_codon:yes gene_type:complete
MKITFGQFSPVQFSTVTVEVINRQQKVEYKIISGIASEKEVRAALGDVGRSGCEPFFTGFYSDRKPVIKRLEKKIQELEKQVDDMKFSLKVTKKKHWSKLIK